jgi:hypothetical protein
MNIILGALLENVIPEQVELIGISMKAFARSAHLTNRNFKHAEQRKFIMESIIKASNVEDEDTLKSTMEALNEIVRVNYDYIEEYIMGIGEITTGLIGSVHEGAA